MLSAAAHADVGKLREKSVSTGLNANGQRVEREREREREREANIRTLTVAPARSSSGRRPWTADLPPR